MIFANCDYTENVRFFIRGSYFYLLFIMLVSVINPSLAGIVADKKAAKNQQPNIHHYIEDKKLCKVQDAYCQGATFTTVNIVTPNEHGVSHNKYDKFNIKFGKGFNRVFLNNLEINSPGFVGNPNLVNQTATVILNEVTSNKQSELYGALSVIGAKAHVIIANPSGIRCNNCQFINTDHVTLTTGSPLFTAGALTGYEVNQGDISIDRNGLKFDDNPNAFLDLFSATLGVDGEIRGGIIQAIIGKQNIIRTPIRKRFDTQLIGDHFDNEVTNVAIDVTQLGGMYANKIFLYSKNGGIQNKGMLEAETVVSLASASFIKNSTGRIYSPKTKLRSSGDIDIVSGKIKSERQGVNYKIDERFGIRILGRNINSSESSFYANSGYISIEAADSINNWNSIIKSNATSGLADISLKAKLVNNNNGHIVTSQNILIDANELRNNNGRIISAFRDVNLSYKTLSNEEGVIYGGIDVNRIIKK